MEDDRENLFPRLGKAARWPSHQPILLAVVRIAPNQTAEPDWLIRGSERQIPMGASQPEHVSSGARYSDPPVPRQRRGRICAKLVPRVESNLSRMSRIPMRLSGHSFFASFEQGGSSSGQRATCISVDKMYAIFSEAR